MVVYSPHTDAVRVDILATIAVANVRWSQCVPVIQRQL